MKSFKEFLKEALKNKHLTPMKTHTTNCHYNIGHDCNCKGKLIHNTNCDYNTGHDCNCGLIK